MGGFKVTADYCADDFVLGNETYKLGADGGAQPSRHRPHGHQLELRGVAPAPGALDEVDALFAAQGTLRHRAHLQHAVRPAGAGRGCWLGHPLVGAGAAGLGLATRLALSIAVGRMVVRDPSWFGLLVLYPVRDLMGFGFWAASYWGRRILWRGRVYELLPGGKMRAAK